MSRLMTAQADARKGMSKRTKAEITKTQIDVQKLVIKQSGYSDNLTALYINMNATMQYYSAVLGFISNPLSPELAQHASQRIHKAAEEIAPSWLPDKGNLELLERCIKDSDNVGEEWLETKELFVMAAFKDLTRIKNPQAMDLFCNIRERVLAGDEDGFVWARTVKNRPDGSAVIVLHVSSLAMFEKALDRSSVVRSGTLEEGILLTH